MLNNTIIHDEMAEFAELVMKYSSRQLTVMVAAVDIDDLQRDMIANGATREELRKASECHHDIRVLIRAGKKLRTFIRNKMKKGKA